MDKNELIRKLMKTFVAELGDYVASLNRDIMALERGADAAARAEIFKNLFRTGHSLKGTARSMGFDLLADMGHHLESLFTALRDGKAMLDGGAFALLFDTADAIADAARRLDAGLEIKDGPVPTLLPRLEAAAIPAAAAPPAALAPGAPATGLATMPAPPPVMAPARFAPAEPPAAAPAPEESAIRIATGRLDRLIALGGELRVAQGRAGARDRDIERLIAASERWHGEWRALERSLAKSSRATGDTTDDQAVLAARAIDMGRENAQWLTRSLEQLRAALVADRKALEQVATPLDREVLGVRMTPFGRAASGLERSVRDLARAVGKEVDLVLEGARIEVDRQVMAAIKDSLLHLIRNAVDHGLETPAERIAAGKPPRGRLTVSAALRRGMVEIRIADDGRGFDLGAIRAKAAALGLAVPEDDAGAARLAFTHGFSTARNVSDISGRGVGLDVVKTAVESQRGTVDIVCAKGKGTQFILTVPLTLTRLHALLVSAGGRTYAFDSGAIHGLKRISPADLRTLEGRDAIVLPDGPLPLYRLADLLGLAGDAPEAAKLPVIVIGHGADRIGVVVDRLDAEQEIMVKDLGPRLPRITGVAGATILADGQVALILNAADLLRIALGRAPAPVLTRAFATAPAAAKKRLLVADDSLTTRTLVKSILEAHGFEVIDAADGMGAWQLLQEKGADLVVSDVEMPRMDGFALTTAIRGSKRLAQTPVILVTALESEKDRMRGLDAGADAYLPKSTFDQTNLLQAIERLI